MTATLSLYFSAERAQFRIWDYSDVNGQGGGVIICSAACERREPGNDRGRTDIAARLDWMTFSEGISAWYVEEAEAQYRKRFTVEFDILRCPCSVRIVDHEYYLATIRVERAAIDMQH